MIIDAEVAIIAFVSSWAWTLAFFWKDIESGYANLLLIIPMLIHFLLFSKSRGNLKQVTQRAYLLGLIFSAGLLIAFHSTKFMSAGIYMIILSTFHFGEYLSTALFNSSQLKLEAFMLNHSKEYNIALLISWIEHGALLYFYPALKQNPFLIIIGCFGCIVGDGFRKLAMYTAGKNFNHIVQYKKAYNHELVTDGVYSIVRHPSYAGWFCWSVSTQVLLCNPLCFIGYFIASWRFFNDRVEYEELTLLSFFGQQYVEYKKNVPSGIPFVYGYQLDTA